MRALGRELADVADVRTFQPARATSRRGHLAPRVWPRQRWRRFCAQACWSLCSGGMKSVMPELAFVDLPQELLQKAVDHEIAARLVVATGAIAALDLLEARSRFAHQSPVTAGSGQ